MFFFSNAYLHVIQNIEYSTLSKTIFQTVRQNALRHTNISIYCKQWADSERDPVEEEDGDWLSAKVILLLLVVATKLTPIPRASVTRRARPWNRPFFAPIASCHHHGPSIFLCGISGMLCIMVNLLIDEQKRLQIAERYLCRNYLDYWLLRNINEIEKIEMVLELQFLKAEIPSETLQLRRNQNVKFLCTSRIKIRVLHLPLCPVLPDFVLTAIQGTLTWM